MVECEDDDDDDVLPLSSTQLILQSLKKMKHTLINNQVHETSRHGGQAIYQTKAWGVKYTASGSKLARSGVHCGPLVLSNISLNIILFKYICTYLCEKTWTLCYTYLLYVAPEPK